MAKSRKRKKGGKGGRGWKGPGRPAGSKNVNGECIEVVPAACRKCGSTERAVLDSEGHRSRIVRISRYEGTMPDGFRYNHTTWLRVRCANCGQERREVHRRFIPKAGREK